MIKHFGKKFVFKLDLSMEYGYEEELNQIRDSIDETFNKLCELWDVIGCVNDGKREERKTTIAASCKNHICQYLDRVYAAEDQVIFLKIGLKVETYPTVKEH